MALKYDEKDQRTMLEVQKELARVCRRANANKVEAALVAFALVRLARELLDKYPPRAHKQLLEQVNGFMNRTIPPPGDDKPTLITLN